MSKEKEKLVRCGDEVQDARVCIVRWTVVNLEYLQYFEALELSSSCLPMTCFVVSFADLSYHFVNYRYHCLVFFVPFHFILLANASP